MENTLAPEAPHLTRYQTKAREDAERLRQLRHLLRRQPVWATVVDLGAVQYLVDGPVDCR